MLDRNSSFEPGQRKHQVVQMLEIKQEDYIKNVILKKRNHKKIKSKEFAANIKLKKNYVSV